MLQRENFLDNSRNSLENFCVIQLIGGKFSREFIAYQLFIASKTVSLLSVLTVSKQTANPFCMSLLKKSNMLI